MENNQVWQLIARKISGEASLDELRELEQLLRDDPELAYKVDLYADYFGQPSAHVKRSEPKKNQSWENCLAKLESEFPESFGREPATTARVRGFVFRRWMAVAASILVFAVSLYWLVGGNVRSKSDRIAGNLKLNEVNTMPGTRSKTVLPDGTIVWLNSDSRLAYNADFGKTRREITLTGEAFFDVAHNAEVPLVVHAKTVNIWVKGTAFNVRSYPESENVETSLIRGSVELTTNSDPDRKILLKPNEKITIETKADGDATPGTSKTEAAVTKQGFYHIDKLKESVSANIIPEVSWVENKLIFDNELFSDMVLKMEKWYNVEIILSDKRLAQKQFSGNFEKENIYEALTALQFINHFEFEIKGRKVFIK